MASTFVRLSVQGVLFLVKESMILSQPWILSKMITSEIPWEKTSEDGQYYVDVDPNSFRLILSILKGVLDLSKDAGQLSRTDLVLLKATARYLLLDDVASQVAHFEAGIEKEMLEKEKEMLEKEKEMLEKEKVLEKELEEMESKADCYDTLEKAMDGRQVKVVRCCAYRTHCPMSECGEQSLIIGSLTPEECTKEDFVPCGDCGNDRSRLYGRRKQIGLVRACDDVDVDTFADYLEFLKS